MANDAYRGGIMVFCEKGPEGFRPVAFELLGLARRLADRKGVKVIAALVGGRAADAQALGACGADAVLHHQADVPPDEVFTARVLDMMCGGCAPDILLVGATAFGRAMAPYLAAELHTGLTADCTDLDIDEKTGLLLQTRPAFGGNLMAAIVCPDGRPQMATVRPRVFPAPQRDQTRTWEYLETPPEWNILSAIGYVPETRSDGVDIGAKDILVSVGMGIGGAENLALARELAGKLGGELAASRAVVDAGLLPYVRQVGQTGKTVSPRLYIALGISGAIQHMVGVAGGVIVAVNTDPDAPICSQADYVIPCDCGAFLRETLARL